MDLRHIISLGAGVQSSTMALMAAHGEIEPMPECAIFADTGWEPAAVYEWLDQLEKLLPYPVHRVGSGTLKEDQLLARARGKKTDGVRWAALPYFTRIAGAAREGRIRRQCTSEYKINPIEQFIKRELLGLRPRQRSPKEPVISQWRGISLDEVYRMKSSRERWMIVRYPLIDQRMTRWDCLIWMKSNGYPQPPRSACIGCPFHSDHEWREMKRHRPKEWQDAVSFDRAIRTAGGIQGDTFLHRKCVPLDQVDLETAEDAGQLSMFNEECEGMCGV